MKGGLLNLKFFIEFIIVRFLFFFISILPMNIISKLGAITFRLFGQLSKNHNTAINNCCHVFPNLPNNKINNIVLKSWENLGKTIFEIGILKRIVNTKQVIDIKGIQNINEFINNKTPAIFFSIHQANWEICVPSLDKIGFQVGAIYRHINNHFIDRFIFNKRTDSLTTKNSFYTPKGKKSAKEILDAAKNNKSIFLLIDQKDSAGEDILFFNKLIKTQIGFLKIARKYNMPLIPMENKRLKDNKFVIRFHKPIYHNNLEISDIKIMENIHSIIEKWIVSNPDQWFWQHNRFN